MRLGDMASVGARADKRVWTLGAKHLMGSRGRSLLRGSEELRPPEAKTLLAFECERPTKVTKFSILTVV